MGRKKQTKVWFDYLERSLYTPNCNFSSAWRWYNHTFSRWSEMDLLSSSTIFNSSQTLLYSTLLFSHGYSTRNYTEWIRETWNLLKSSNGWKTHKLWNFAGGKGNIPHYTTLKHNSYGPLLHFAILSQTWTKKCENLHSALKVCMYSLIIFDLPYQLSSLSRLVGYTLMGKTASLMFFCWRVSSSVWFPQTSSKKLTL